jgi:hypothetical protein
MGRDRARAIAPLSAYLPGSVVSLTVEMEQFQDEFAELEVHRRNTTVPLSRSVVEQLR